jgi:hypothetical protein
MSEEDNNSGGAAVIDMDLAELSAGAAALDGAGQAVVQAQDMAKASEEAATAEGLAPELLDVLKLARAMAVPLFVWWVDFERVWSDAVLEGIAQNGAVIMVRQGWDMGQLMTKWGPYIGLLGITAPAAFATYKAVKAHKAGEHVGHEQTQP